MNRRLLCLLGLAAMIAVLSTADVFAAKSSINVYGMGPYELKKLGLTNARWEDRWFPSGGTHSVARGTKVWLNGAIDSGTAATFAWTLTAPTGSTTTLDSADKWRTSFNADSAGAYVIGLTVNGVATSDTIWAGTS